MLKIKLFAFLILGSLSLSASDIELHQVLPSSGTVFRGGVDNYLLVELYNYSEIPVGNQLDIYYQWKGEQAKKAIETYTFAEKLDAGLYLTFDIFVNTPYKTAEKEELKIFIVATNDNNATNDTLTMNYDLMEKLKYDLKVETIKPTNQSNISIEGQLEFEIKLTNESSSTLPTDNPLILAISLDGEFILNPKIEVYKGPDLAPGESHTIDYTLELPKDFEVGEYEFCFIYTWAVNVGGNYQNVETYVEDNYGCVTLNAVIATSLNNWIDDNYSIFSTDKAINIQNKSAENNNDISVNIYNLSGQKVVNGKLNNSGSSTLQTNQSGLYIVHFLNLKDGSTASKKIYVP